MLPMTWPEHVCQQAKRLHQLLRDVQGEWCRFTALASEAQMLADALRLLASDEGHELDAQVRALDRRHRIVRVRLRPGR